ncbi:MAG TPA: CoA transferase [Candidatus Sulfotelmatobacter sp.]|nr:CoA transferase [Candidatus Sulfotelmatobacter sp.]
MAGALAGLRVIDLSGHLSGPFCAMQLADMGADVIKVERPDGGDDARRMPPFVNGESAPFMVWNRNKRSITLDLKADADRATFLALLETADILLENYRPGTMDRLGLGYAALKPRFPRLIYCAISGFGQTGPESRRGGFDLMTQAMSGLMAVCGPADGPPHRLPIAISDVGAGLYAAIGILSALEARHRTGRGQYVETSLFEAAMSLGVYEAAHYFTTDEAPPRIGQAHRGSSPYQVFKTADGWMTIGASQQNFWTRLCAIVEAPELLEDPRFKTNADRVAHNDALVALLQARLEGQPTAHWLAQLQEAGIPAAPVLTHDRVFTHPQTIAREMVVPVEHAKAGKSRTLGVAVKLSDTPGSVRAAAPTLGQHSAEIRAELAAARPQRAAAGED